MWGTGYEEDIRVVLSGDAVPGLRGFRIRGAELEFGEFAGARSVGDLNGDGLDDIAVAAGFEATVVIFGRRAPRDVNVARPEQRDLWFSTNGPTPVSRAGDVNGDGVDDLFFAPGVYEFDEGEGAPSAVVLFGSRDRRGRVSLRRLRGRGFAIDAPATAFAFGLAADAAGDVDGDGLDDVVVGAFGASRRPPESSEDEALPPGAAWIVYGRRATSRVRLSAPGRHSTRLVTSRRATLGYSVAATGDVNGDGRPDVAVGAPVLSGRGRSRRFAGSTFVVFGSTERRREIDVARLGDQGLRIDGARRNEFSGVPLAAPGDVDRDGFADLLVGAGGSFADDDDDVGPAGAASLVYGGPGGRIDLARRSDRVLTLRGSGVERAGSSLAAGTDLDIDGRPELLVSRPNTCRVGRIDEGDVAAVELGERGREPEPGTGTGRRDTLSGGPVGDAIFGFGGADLLAGRDGHDCLTGGSGDDNLQGGRSGDVLFGDSGADRLAGDSGCDRIFGGLGDDVIRAGPRQVPLSVRMQAPIGARDRDNVEAGPGDDTIAGGVDSDLIDGGSGDDTARGGSADDELAGGSGRDRLRGDAGRDNLDGGAGRDRLRGDGGRDVLDGGGLSDRVFGGPGDDVLVGDGFPYDDGDDGEFFGADRRRVAGPDLLVGGAGRDRLDGGGAPDRLYGGSYGDRLYGGANRDLLVGGSGPDTIEARDGRRDVVRCGPGRDRVRADRFDRVSGCEVRLSSRRRSSPFF